MAESFIMRITETSDKGISGRNTIVFIYVDAVTVKDTMVTWILRFGHSATPVLTFALINKSKK